LQSPNTHTLSSLKAGQLADSTHIRLSCGLSQFPPELYELADSLEILDLTGNALTSLPDDLDRFKKLRILFCSSNNFTHIPEVLGACPSISMIGFKANQIKHIPESAIPSKTLRWFIVTDNALKQVPQALGDCAQLQKLMLAGNQLSQLPDTMANCQRLELLRISANQFHNLPNWLFNLASLTWLAYAGNPFCNQAEQALMSQKTVPKIAWQDLVLGKVLGQGASGVSYQATWQHDYGESEQVAVKLFKAGLTSDGLPSCEMNANILAGEHANLVGIKGVLRHHPEGVQGIVMPLLDSDLSTLAQPPSFETCSRDVYSADTKLSSAQVKHIAIGVANAMQHLHEQGLMHGDLYGHNILWNDQQVILSDLGGASFLPMQDQVLAQKLINLDKRAYQVLLEELSNL
jgi:hypothetical protein